jgi:hypothetical protein
MRHYRIPADITAQYLRSVHGQALLKKGDLSAPHCAVCHSPHGAMPPGVKDVASVCGQCHINEKEYFKESVHHQAMLAKKVKECVSCHGNHEILHPSTDFYEKGCLVCHPSDSEAQGVGLKIKGLLDQMGESLRRAQAAITAAKKKSLDIDEEESRLLEVQTNILQSQPITHTLSSDRVAEYTTKIQVVTQEITGQISQRLAGLERRKIGLLIFWVFILISISIFHLKRRQVRKKD